MYLISEHYYKNKKHWTVNSLVDFLGLPVEPVQDTFFCLKEMD
jgi:hypothetical protein